MQVLVIGASRGLGLGSVRQYRADGAQVNASARHGVYGPKSSGLEAPRRADFDHVMHTNDHDRTELEW